jgi:Ca2+-binding EF-hand superfamily protein
MGSMRAFLWTMLLLFIVLYIFGVYFTQLVLNHRLGTESLNLPMELDNFYGSLGSTVLGLFQSVTGGLDWEAMSTPLMKEVTPMLAVMFVFFISFTTLAVLNLVTGVFVESAILRAKEDKDLCIVSQARMLFKTMDDDFHSSGEISWSTFAAHLSSAEMKSFFDSMEIDISHAQSVFQLIDDDGSGSIDAGEFLSGCLRLRGTAKSLDMLLLSRKTHELVEEYLLHHKVMSTQLNSIMGELRKVAKPSQKEQKVHPIEAFV